MKVTSNKAFKALRDGAYIKHSTWSYYVGIDEDNKFICTDEDGTFSTDSVAVTPYELMSKEWLVSNTDPYEDY